MLKKGTCLDSLVLTVRVKLRRLDHSNACRVKIANEYNERLADVVETPALRAGVDGYVKKDCDLQEIVEAVRETHCGRKFFCSQILDTIKREGIDLESLDVVDPDCAGVSLSKRELEVIRLIAEGFTNPQISEKLFVSPHTITTHRRNILQKLGANNTASVVMYAVQAGLVSPNKFLFAPEA